MRTPNTMRTSSFTSSGCSMAPTRPGFAAHLQGCAECRAKIEVARRHVAMFALASPQTEPPPALRESILALFRAGRREGVKGAPSVPARRGLWTPAWARVLAVVCVLLRRDSRVAHDDKPTSFPEAGRT